VRVAFFAEHGFPPTEFRRLAIGPGGWLDLAARKLVVPPPALIQAMRLVPRAAAFVDLPPT